MKKINYAELFTLRSDGRYMGYYKDKTGRHAIYDRDPQRLYEKIQEKEKPTPATFNTVADAWERQRFDALAYKTVEAYKPCLKRIVARFGDMQLTAIETIDINAFLNWLKGRGYAKRTVQMHRDIVSQIFNYAIANQMTRYNPCDHAELPKGLPQSTRGIPDDEYIDRVQQNTDHPFALFGLLCLYAGLRRGEALALRYDDIDKKAKIIHINKSVEYVSNNPHIKQPKTENGKRDVLLLDVLAQYIPNGTGYIFANERGDIISRDRYRDRWLSYTHAIGCDGMTAHQLRHGFATILYEAGVADKDAQELLGHSDITLTRNIYTHIRKAHREDVATRINSYILENRASSRELSPSCHDAETH